MSTYLSLCYPCFEATFVTLTNGGIDLNVGKETKAGISLSQAEDCLTHDAGQEHLSWYIELSPF